MASEKKFATDSKSFFVTFSLGIASARDSWVYNSDIKKLELNMNRMIEFYNEQTKEFNEKVRESIEKDLFINEAFYIINDLKEISK